MGIVARVPSSIFKEVLAIQREYKANGVDITFTQAFKLWERKVKGLGKVGKKWRFPEFS